MRFHALTIAVLVGLAMPIMLQAQEQQTFTGKVLDADGKPVAGADVATHWLADSGKMQPQYGIRTDKEGMFTLTYQSLATFQGLLAMDKDRKTGGLVVVSKAGTKEVEIKLSPLVKLHGDFFSKELNKKPAFTNVIIWTGPNLRVADCRSQKAEFYFLLPPGKYKFSGFGSDVQDVHKELTLSADTPDLDLKTLDTEATIIARHVGKAPPAWNVTDARGAKKDVTLSDYKGKWVLVEFWGFW